MKLQTVKIEDLKFNEVQPHYRTERKNLRGLLGSISENGVLQPVLVNEKTMEIIDGHRRVAVLKILGIDNVPAILFNGELRDRAISSVDAFTICNSDTKILRKIDFLNIYKKGGNIPSGIASSLIRITERLGSKFIDTLIERKQAPQTVERFFIVADIMGYTDRKALTKFVTWVYKHKMWLILRTFEKDIRENPNSNIAKKLKESIELDVPLIFSVK